MQKLKGLIVTLIATALGSGFTPKAPGTAGTIVGLFLVYLIRDWSFPTQAFFDVALFFVGWWATLAWSRNVGQTDSQKIVIDEVLGYLVAMGTLPRTPSVLIIQFILFRIFDSLKPPPIRQFDRWGKGFEVGPAQSFMVIWDDLLAGLLSLAVFCSLGALFSDWIK